MWADSKIVWFFKFGLTVQKLLNFEKVCSAIIKLEQIQKRYFSI